MVGMGRGSAPQMGNGSVELQLPTGAPPITPPPVLSRCRVNTVPELGWLPQEFLRLALLMCESGVTNRLETQNFASGGHKKKVDGLSLRKLGSLRKLEEAFSWCLRGVARGGSVRLPNVNLRVDRRNTQKYFSRKKDWGGTFSRAPASVIG